MQRELEEICRVGLPAHRLPAFLHVWHLKNDYSNLWLYSYRDQAEWGACLDLGTEGLSLVDEVRGDQHCVAPLCAPLAKDPHYIGFAHVHLPDPCWGGRYIGFSASDYRATLADGDRLALVHNGEETFALVRTTATMPPHRIQEEEYCEWVEMFNTALRAAPLSINQKLWEVNCELCRRLGFAFYRGRFGEPLQRIYQPLRRAQ